MFSLMWSEHCAYKHSRQLLQDAADRGPARSCWARARTPARSTSATGWRARSRSSRTTTRARSSRSRARRPASAASCATSSRSARGRSRCSTRCASASRRLGPLALPARARRRRHRPLRQLDRRRHRRRRDLLRGALRAELPGQRDVRRADRARRADPVAPPRAWATSSCCSARAPAATGSAARRCWPAPSSTTPTRQAPDRADRRPVRGEEAARVLARAARPRAARRAAGPRRRRADLVVAPRWRPRARSASTSTCAACRCARPDMEPFEIMVSESQERMLCVVEPDAASTRCSPSARAGRSTRRRSARSPTRGGCACSTARSWSATCRSSALVDECPAYDLEPVEPARPLYPAPPRDARRRRDPARAAARAARLARTSPRGAGRSSSTTAIVGSRTVRRPEAGRRRRAPAARRRRARDRGLDRRQRPPRGRRPVPRRGRGRARVRGQPGLRRRRAARPDQLPELRQPGEAAHRLAAHARGRRARRRLPRARRARSSAATCRSTTRAREGPIYPTPVVGMVGELPDAGARRPARLRAPRRRGRAGRRRLLAPSAAASELAKLRGEPVAGPLPDADLGELRALHAAVRQAVRSGALRSRARRRRGRRRRRAGRVLRSPAAVGASRRASDGVRAVRRGPGRVRRLRRRARRCAAFGAAARVIGEVGGDALEIEGVLTLAARRPRARPHRGAAGAGRLSRSTLLDTSHRCWEGRGEGVRATCPPTFLSIALPTEAPMRHLSFRIPAACGLLAAALTVGSQTSAFADPVPAAAPASIVASPQAADASVSQAADDVCFFYTRGDYVHPSGGDASGHGWWDNIDCPTSLRGRHGAAGGVLQRRRLAEEGHRRQGDGERPAAAPGTARPGAGACNGGTAKTGWRSVVDVDLVGISRLAGQAHHARAEHRLP